MRSRTKRPRKRRPYSLEGYIIGALRRVWRYHPTRREALKRAAVANGRYRCAACKKAAAEVAVDHIHPVVNPATGRLSWDEYIGRLFCPVEGVQVLCKKPCHAAKTKQENAERKRSRKESE